MTDNADKLFGEPNRGLERLACPDLIGHVNRGAHHAGDLSSLIAKGGERGRENAFFVFAVIAPDRRDMFGRRSRLASPAAIRERVQKELSVDLSRDLGRRGAGSWTGW